MIPLLEIKDLTITFDSEKNSVPALKNVNLKVNRGEITAVVGESGSGKSVTAMSVLRLLQSPPARYVSGQILLSQNKEAPIDLLTQSPETIRLIRGNRIAMIFQEPMTSLNPVLSCGKQVMEAILVHNNIDSKTARERVLRLFEKVRLPEPSVIFKKYPHQLSGGQKQRVMIAMAMSCSPDLLIADEPTTALDVTVQKSILALIKELQHENKMGVIFITHDLGLVQEIADSIVVMYKGEVVESGDAKKILTAPGHPYTQALLACRPAGKRKDERLPVVSDFLKEHANVQPELKTKTLREKVKPIISDKPLVLVENISVAYKSNGLIRKKKHIAVDDVSFEIFPGETLGLVGESGSGKTSLGRALVGLTPIHSGRILFDGRDSSMFNKKQWKEIRQEVQIVFQDPYASLNPRMTAGNAIAEPLVVHDPALNSAARKSQVLDLLDKVNMGAGYFNRYPHQFSGGQRQRIGIARALILEPEFIVFDESVSALDVSVQAQVLNMLRDLKEELQFTALFISHDLSVVHYVSDRILVMHQGKIIETGTADEIFLNPKEEYTQKLVSAVPGNPFKASFK